MGFENASDLQEKRASARVFEGELNRAAEDFLNGRKYAASIDRKVVRDVAQDMDDEGAIG